jgi:CheY-like chemotaxis protein
MDQEKQIQPPIRILLVDDAVANLHVLRHALELDGYEILVATSGAAGLRIAVRLVPDLVLLDVFMPGMDGFEVCRRLRAVEATRQTPVMFLTGQAEVANVEQAIAVGGTDYTSKPFVATELRRRVQTLVELVQLRRSNVQLRAELDTLWAAGVEEIVATQTPPCASRGPLTNRRRRERRRRNNVE